MSQNIDMHQGTAVMRNCRKVLLIGAYVIIGALPSACLGLQAKAPAVPEPLDMPAPPPRVVEVRDPAVPPPVPLPEEPVRTTPLRPRPPGPPAETSKPAEPARTEPVAAEVKPPEEPRPATATTLQTTPTQQEGEVERRVRALLSQATADLNRINYQALNVDARTQYDTAKRFVTQSDEALRAKNLRFAGNLADKAAALAAQLAGR